MIGCDKCDEWYHPVCVGLDITLIQDIATFDFVCPSCKAIQEKKVQKSHKKGTSAPQTAKPVDFNQNKRTVKAGAKQDPPKETPKPE